MLDDIEESTGKNLTQHFAHWYEKLFSALVLFLIFLSVMAVWIIYTDTPLGKRIQDEEIFIRIFFCAAIFILINVVYLFFLGYVATVISTNSYLKQISEKLDRFSEEKNERA
jgi:hypothetical protein